MRDCCAGRLVVAAQSESIVGISLLITHSPWWTKAMSPIKRVFPSRPTQKFSGKSGLEQIFPRNQEILCKLLPPQTRLRPGTEKECANVTLCIDPGGRQQIFRSLG